MIDDRNRDHVNEPDHIKKPKERVAGEPTRPKERGSGTPASARHGNRGLHGANDDQAKYVNVPTDEELEQLARVWYGLLIQQRLDYMYLGITDSGDLYMAQSNLNRIASWLGADRTEAACKEVDADWRQRLGERVWGTYKCDESPPIVDIPKSWAEQHGSLFDQAADSLAVMAVRAYPELTDSELQEALRRASKRFAQGPVEVEPCEHEWIPDPRPQRTDSGSLTPQRCTFCGRIRSLEVSDPDGRDDLPLLWPTENPRELH